MKIVGVIGAGSCTDVIYEQARKIGQGIARLNAVLVCGGLGGVMEGACRGAFESGGVTMGILPGSEKSEANPYVTIPVVSDLGHARNIIIAHTADVLIAVSGGYGTLSEISISLKLGKPVIGLGTWANMEKIAYVDNAASALKALEKHLAP
jgi:uncharacterized protein (TIGR00725 family)